MEPDHYAALGIPPNASDAAVHSAYRALIRRYHPDRNGSEQAADRSRRINAAYAVLRDRRQRADYDARRQEEPRTRVRRTGPLAAGALSAVAAGLLLFALFGSRDGAEEGSGLAAAGPAAGGAASILDHAPAVSPPQNRAPAGVEEEEDISRLAEPPRAASAVESAAEIEPPEQPAAAEPARAAPRPRRVEVAAAPAAPGQVDLGGSDPDAPAGPSFDCRKASNRSERRICGSPDLAFLDRRHAFFQAQSIGNADGVRRTQLLATGEAFVSRRDSCRTSTCITTAYLDRLREISEIMQRSPPSP